MKYEIDLTTNQAKRVNDILLGLNESFGYPKDGLHLKPVEEINLKLEKDVSYERGYENGYTEGYDKALEDLAHAMKVYYPLNSVERLEHFGTNQLTERYAMENPKDLIAKVKAYEEKKTAIKVGDVVKFNEKCHRYESVKDNKYLVLHVFENRELATLLYPNGDTGASSISLLDKTGRHISEAEGLQEQLNKGV